MSQQPPLTPLVNALLSGKKIKKILSKLGSNINTLGDIGFSALHIVLQEEETAANLKNLKQLLAHKSIDVNVLTKSGFTPLYIATQQKDQHLRAIDLLLQHPNIDPNAPASDDGSTPLCRAASQGYLAGVQKLLAHPDTDVNQSKFTGFTPLTLACQRSHNHDVIALLLAHPSIDPNRIVLDAQGGDVSWQYGVFALLCAATRGDTRLVSMLLEHSLTNVNLRPSKVGNTALSAAVAGGHEDVVALLCRHPGIKVSKKFYIQGGEGRKATPLYLAAQDGRAGCCQILLQSGAAPDLYVQCTALKHTPLEAAQVRGAAGTIKLLQKAMADFSWEDAVAGAAAGDHDEGESDDDDDDYEEGFDKSIFEKNMVEMLHLNTMKISNNCNNCHLMHSSFSVEDNRPPFKKCSKCQRVHYCSRECQIEHWKKSHKHECPQLVLLGPPPKNATNSYSLSEESEKPSDLSATSAKSTGKKNTKKKKAKKKKAKKKKGGAKLTPVRFPIGTRIECLGPDGMFGLGTVVAHHYREPSWEEGRTAPYQIRMNKGNRLLSCPVDSNEIISGPIPDDLWEKHAV